MSTPAEGGAPSRIDPGKWTPSGIDPGKWTPSGIDSGKGERTRTGPTSATVGGQG
ncbi:hypothetical protein ACQPZJ_40280 [Actinoplanes sp. CA-054009]